MYIEQLIHDTLSTHILNLTIQNHYKNKIVTVQVDSPK